MKLCIPILLLAFLLPSLRAETWGSADYIGAVYSDNGRVENVGAYDPDDSETMAVWYGLSSLTTPDRLAMGGDTNFRWFTRWTESFQVVVGVYLQGPVLSVGEVHHYMATSAGAAGTGYLYEDGTVVDSDTTDPVDPPSSELDIGGVHYFPTNTEQVGYGADYRIYSEPLSSDMADTIYLGKGRDRVWTNIVGQWLPTNGAAPGASIPIEAFQDRTNGGYTAGTYQGTAPVAGYLLPQLRRRSAAH